MQCLIFSASNPSNVCGARATRYAPLAIGQQKRMHEMDDALLLGFVPLCKRHSENVPATYRLYDDNELIYASAAING